MKTRELVFLCGLAYLLLNNYTWTVAFYVVACEELSRMKII